MKTQFMCSRNVALFASGSDYLHLNQRWISNILARKRRWLSDRDTEFGGLVVQPGERLYHSPQHVRTYLRQTSRVIKMKKRTNRDTELGGQLAGTGGRHLSKTCIESNLEEEEEEDRDAERGGLVVEPRKRGRTTVTSI